MKLSIIIVNFNTPDFTARCLDSIAAAPPECEHEIIIVDNGSIDGSAKWLEAKYTEPRLLISPHNLGIAGGNNLGIRASSGRFVLLLNNDTLVLPGSIDQAVMFLDEHAEAGAIGGQLLNIDGSFQSGFFDFPSLWQVLLITTRIGQIAREYYPSNAASEGLREVDWMSSAFMLFRRSAIERVGLMDEEYFIYSDETDLQFRLKEDGWRILFSPSIRTIHYGGRSLNRWRRRKMVYRGHLLFFRKHYGRERSLMLRLMLAALSALKLLFWIVRFISPGHRERSRHEMSSNFDIVRMCIRPGIESATGHPHVTLSSRLKVSN